jgi:hypothetical protein
MFPALLYCAVTLSLDDIAIGVLSSVNCLDDRILPASRTWATLAGGVDVYVESDLPDEFVTELLANPYCNMSFHIQRALPHYIFGTDSDDGWFISQSRHLLAIADLYERHPHKSFYFICDDDTYVLPHNLVWFASQLDPHKHAMYGKVFQPFAEARQFFKNHPTHFLHGGSGRLITGDLMRTIGPRLRECNLIFDIPDAFSDIRFALCLTRCLPVPNETDERIIQVNGFNSGRIRLKRDHISTTRQITFHKIVGDEFDALFISTLTIVDKETYINWSPISLQSMKFSIGGNERAYVAVFGQLICLGFLENTCVRAETGFVKTNKTFGNFSQKYEMDFMIYLRCNEILDIDELVYFGTLPPPDFGIILEVKCPKLDHFQRRDLTKLHITVENDSMI